MKIREVLLVILGYLLLIVGAVGAFVPIWPTTPFVLLAIGCFSGSPKTREKMLKIKFISDHYYNYRYRRGLKKSSVFISLGILWPVLLLSMAAVRELWAFLLLSAVGVAVTVHILWIARPKKEIRSD